MLPCTPRRALANNSYCMHPSTRPSLTRAPRRAVVWTQGIHYPMRTCSDRRHTQQQLLLSDWNEWTPPIGMNEHQLLSRSRPKPGPARSRGQPHAPVHRRPVFERDMRPMREWQIYQPNCTAQPTMANDSDTDSDLACPPDGKHPSARNTTPAMLLRSATRRRTACHVVAHPGPSDSE
jgi:hypothetical protein